MIETVRSSRRLASVLVLLAAVAACDDSTGPSGELNPRATADELASMVATAEGVEDAFASMEAAGDLFQSGAAASLAGRDLLLDAEAARRFLTGPRPEAFFPSNFLGTTFEYSEAEGRYVATELAGAPDDGIRIVYYAEDPITEEPQADVPLGYVDLRDLSTASATRLGVEIVNTAGATPITLALYTIDASWTVSDAEIGAALAAAGHLSDGAARLNFDLGQTITLSETGVGVTQDFGMGVQGSDLSVRYLAELTGTLDSEESGALSMSVTVRDDGHAMAFDVDVTQTALDGTVTTDGTVVAYIAGTPEDPTFTDPDGAAMDPSEVEALRDLFAAARSLFELAGGIFAPAQ